MHRRRFLSVVATTMAVTLLATSPAAAANKKFLFKIKTKSGGIVGNILIEAKDQFAAVAKLMRRYPGCEILEGRER